jgi:hypothetical protein
MVPVSMGDCPCCAGVWELKVIRELRGGHDGFVDTFDGSPRVYPISVNPPCCVSQQPTNPGQFQCFARGMDTFLVSPNVGSVKASGPEWLEPLG